MNRRNFIKNTSGFISIPMLLRGLPIAATGSQLFYNAIAPDNDKILVLIQLNGGNDGLNTIIPIDHLDLLNNVRPNIVIPEGQIININDTTGLHPAMDGMRSLYDNARMAILQDVAYPNQNRSHFRSLDIWTSGSPADEVWTSGWLGRYLEGCHPAYPENFPNDTFPDPFALSIGSIVSETCQGTLTNFSLALTDPLSIAPLSNDAQSDVPDNPYGRELDFLRTTLDQANAYGSVISLAAAKGSNVTTDYPDTGLANQLKAISLLISGGLQTKVYVANIGGFDTHANQVQEGTPTLGDHATLLQNLSDAVTSFQQDLAAQGLEERVLTMTFSEFGRRIRSNGSFGTDHGTAAPMMFFGSCVRSGIIGDSPMLPDNPDGGDGVPMQFDFRSVYGSVLIDWFGVSNDVVKNILGDQFTYISIANGCNDQTTPTDDIEDPIDNVYSYPNPFDRWTNIALDTSGGRIRISVFDNLGHEVDVITSRSFTAGSYTIKYDGSHLPSGNYYTRVISEHGSKTFNMVKAR